LLWLSWRTNAYHLTHAQTVVECTSTRVNSPVYSKPYDDSAEPIFPPALMRDAPPALAIVGSRVMWHAPTNMATLLDLKTKFPVSAEWYTFCNSSTKYIRVSCTCTPEQKGFK
jgi:hypothetical protein